MFRGFPTLIYREVRQDIGVYHFDDTSGYALTRKGMYVCMVVGNRRFQGITQKPHSTTRAESFFEAFFATRVW